MKNNILFYSLLFLLAVLLAACGRDALPSGKPLETPTDLNFGASASRITNTNILAFYSETYVLADNYDLYYWNGASYGNYNISCEGTDLSDSTAPEGSKVLRVTEANSYTWFGLGFTVVENGKAATNDMSAWSSSTVHFFVSSESTGLNDLQFGVEAGGSITWKSISSYAGSSWNDGTWHEISVSMSDLGISASTLQETSIYFCMRDESVSAGDTFKIDSVYWTRE